jgi:Tfp pilus assembly protein PilW
MDFKTTSTRRRAGSTGGFTLLEALFSIGVTAIVVASITAFSVLSSRNFVVMANYVDLDNKNRIAMDTLSRDLRQCNKVTAFATNSITVEDFDGVPLTYTYSPGAHTLSRLKNGVSDVYLTECDVLNFSIGQRNPVNGAYDVYPAATADTAKVVTISWRCSRGVYGMKENTESVQTARIVIRKQGT